MTPIAVFCSAFAIGALCGLAALIHDSKRLLTKRLVTSALLYNGMSGLISVLFMFDVYGQERPSLLLATAGLVGFGGVTVLDVAKSMFKKSGISIKFGRDSSGKRDRRDGEEAAD